jgi:hypothetical protein
LARDRGQQSRENVRIGRLDHVVVEACLKAPLAIGHLAETGKRDERDPIKLGSPPDPASQLVSIHPRHCDVQQDHVWGR